MKINVGSKNTTKINAVQEALLGSYMFKDAEVVGVDVLVPEFGHPKTLTECVDGAILRAKNAFSDCDLSIGIEGGLMEVPHTKTGYMEVAACAIYNGKEISLGLSPGHEWPKKMQDKILEGLDGSQAAKAAGLTKEEKIGTTSGTIHLLTKGRINRTKYNEIAVTMALIQLENPEHY